MSTQNFFALLGDDENEDPMALAARVVSTTPAVPALKEQKRQPEAQATGKFPTKPLPPEQAIREARVDGNRGRGRRGRGFFGGRGNYGNRDRGYENGEINVIADRGDYGDRAYRNGSESRNDKLGHAEIGHTNDGFPAPAENGGGGTYEGGRGRGRGRGRTNGYAANGEEGAGRRTYERRSGTGRGNEIKREGAGKGNWGLEVDQNIAQDVEENNTIADESKNTMSNPIEKNVEETQVDPVEKKEAEEEDDKEMTLEEYEKILEEKRKGLQALKAEERKVLLDREFESMQLIDKKIDEVFLKLGSEKGKKKEILEKEERVRKSMNINEFLRPADGERHYFQSGRQGRSGGRGRGGLRGGFGGRYRSFHDAAAPEIGDPGHFPTLGGH